MHYLDHACYSPPSPTTQSAVLAAVTSQVQVGEFGATDLALDWLRCRDKARGAVARLTESVEEDVTLVESTSHGLGIIAGGLQLRPGDNVVVPDSDFLGLPAVFKAKERRGVHIRAAPSRRGLVTVDGLRQVVDRRTRVIVVSAVQEVSGAPVDLDQVADLAAAYDALFVVDGIHEAGVLRRDPARHGLAAYAAGGHKWLRNPYGLGFLWTSPSLRAQLSPPFQGYFALPEPPGGWAQRLNDRNVTAVDIPAPRRDGAALEIGGTPNWLGAVGLATAIEQLLATGAAEVERRALMLADRLRDGLLGLGIQPVTPVGSRSSIVTFELEFRGIDSRDLVESARARGIQVSARAVAGSGGIRASCHAHNEETDVDALLEVVKSALHSPLRMSSR